MKTGKRYFGRLLLAALALVLASGCAMTTVREHPDFASKTRQVKNIGILPVDAEILYLVLTGDNERLPEDEQKIRDELAKALPSLLEGRGYQARLIRMEDLGKIMKEANFTVEQVKTAYSGLSKRLYERNMVSEEESTNFRISIGPIGTAIADAMQIDAFLFARYDGFKKSPGLISKDVVAGAMLGVLTGVVVVPAPNGGQLEIALIDSQSGDVFWTNRMGGPVQASGVAKILLDKLPATGAVAEQEKAKELAKVNEAAKSGGPESVDTAKN